MLACFFWILSWGFRWREEGAYKTTKNSLQFFDKKPCLLHEKFPVNTIKTSWYLVSTCSLHIINTILNNCIHICTKLQIWTENYIYSIQETIVAVVQPLRPVLQTKYQIEINGKKILHVKKGKNNSFHSRYVNYALLNKTPKVLSTFSSNFTAHFICTNKHR